MVLNKNAGLFEVTIEIGEYFDTDAGDVWVTFRGPNNEEMIKMQTVETEMMSNEGIEFDFEDENGVPKKAKLDPHGMEKRNRFIWTLMSKCVKEHNIEFEEGKSVSNKELWSEFEKRPLLVDYMRLTWRESLPKQDGKEGK